MRTGRILGAVAMLMVGMVSAAPMAAGTGSDAACRVDRALLATPAGQVVAVSVEIADDAAERAQGLMNRPHLPQGEGMLFVYETPRQASFWMKNTLIPLDLLFFDARGVLRHVHPQARPLDLTPIPGAARGDPDPPAAGAGTRRRRGRAAGSDPRCHAAPPRGSAGHRRGAVPLRPGADAEAVLSLC